MKGTIIKKGNHCINDNKQKIKKRTPLKILTNDELEVVTKNETVETEVFTDKILNNFINKVKPKIDKLYQRPNKEFVYEPTVFSNDTKEDIENEKIAFKHRQKKMKEGELAQILIGNWYGWEDLGVGHSSGLDCRKKDNNFILDVKNKWNTCNSGSEKALCDKLSNYKKENPETRCIWAIVNPKPNYTKLCEKISHNGVTIEKIQGDELFKLVFTLGNVNYSTQIINFVKNYTSKY